MLAALLLLCFHTAHAKAPHRQDPPREAGKKLYQDTCWQCHGERGLGDGPLSAHVPSPPLAGRIARPDFDPHVDLILQGQGAMPAFSPILNVSEARTILLWLEGLDPTTGLDPNAASDDEAEGEGDEEEAPEGKDERDEVKANDAD